MYRYLYLYKIYRLQWFSSIVFDNSSVQWYLYNIYILRLAHCIEIIETISFVSTNTLWQVLICVYLRVLYIELKAHCTFLVLLDVTIPCTPFSPRAWIKNGKIMRGGKKECAGVKSKRRRYIVVWIFDDPMSNF